MRYMGTRGPSLNSLGLSAWCVSFAASPQCWLSLLTVIPSFLIMCKRFEKATDVETLPAYELMSSWVCPGCLTSLGT